VNGHHPQPGPRAAEPPAAEPQASVDQGLGEHATGDIVIDSALQDLRNAPDDDLDAQIEAGRRVQETLQARLGDLGGE
jgi:DNA polymerase-3 subunit gamma/tau